MPTTELALPVLSIVALMALALLLSRPIKLAFAAVSEVASNISEAFALVTLLSSKFTLSKKLLSSFILFILKPTFILLAAFDKASELISNATEPVASIFV